VKNSFWKYGSGFPFASTWPASVVGHCGGVIAPSRIVDVCIWPS
jgi:hypothetical protein